MRKRRPVEHILNVEIFVQAIIFIVTVLTHVLCNSEVFVKEQTVN